MDKKNVKKVNIETKVGQKIATATKAGLFVVVASSVLLLNFLAKLISYEFYLLIQKDAPNILSSNVVGYVRDINSLEPLSGVEISFDDYKAISNNEGYYILQLPGPGEYQVSVDGESIGAYQQVKDYLPVISLPYVHNIYLAK